MKLLYSSADVRNAVVQLFRSSTKRRVAISAFVSDGAEAYLPKPSGLELICWPKAGGTNPDVLRKLIARGAEVAFADSLHMKVYWSEDQGAVITSANLSTNALGSGNLKEMGILLHPGKLNIDRLIQSFETRQVTESELRELDRRTKEYIVRNRWASKGKSRVSSYQEWLHSPFRSEWKLGWWDSTGSIAKEARKISKEEYNVSEPKNFLAARKRDYKENDWVLSFNINKPSEVGWLFVNYVVKVAKTERAHCPQYPYQAVQVWPMKYYPPHPFRIEKELRKAFSGAISEFGSSRIEDLKSCKPPKRLLNLIQTCLSKG